ncbi:MAG: ATP-binding protein [Planctomycetaceae bacterium]|nr:ATP-binding protein [Planctomycetaceae bacterium]
MTEEKNENSEIGSSLQEEQNPNLWRGWRIPALGIREKLIIIFLFVKVLPLILLAFIAWQALVSLGLISRETAVTDSREALTALAVENIERMSTDAAEKVAEFLYQRDTDIIFLARLCEHISFDNPEKIKEVFVDFGDERTRLVRRHGEWVVDENGTAWVGVDPYVPPAENGKRSANEENENKLDGATFHYRPPLGFGDDLNRFVRIPLYDEIALLDLNGKQIAKHVSQKSPKKRFPFPKELLDVSDPKNTFVKAERYFEELPKLGKDGIYVSDVIGAYVPSRFIGMFTPDFVASKRIDAKIAELEADESGNNAETIWKLRVLNAELKNDEEKFNSPLEVNRKTRDEIDRRLGPGRIWKIENKPLPQVSEELKTLGFPELAEEILAIPSQFKPEEEAYAGAENPVGIRFEGIVRWAKPVLDANGDVQGYVTFALNHDHLMEMVDHITPMPQRYTELSDAYSGNYAFIWDYQCRSIVHPRHHSICGYNPETGKPETPWLEKTLYDGMIAAGFDRADWQDYIATLEDYVPWTGDKNSPAYQTRTKKPAGELAKMGLVGLDGRYLNFAPQCTGWMDLVKDGGSGSLYILWSGLYKLNTAAAIPYYTGQYSPEVRGNRCGFGFVAIGAGVDDFSHPANDMGERLTEMVQENVKKTTFHLVWTTIVLSIIVIFIAVWMASFLSRKLQWLIDGITRFRSGDRSFRFTRRSRDEFGRLALSFNEMAENIVQSVHTPLVITDMDLNVVYVNEQCLEILEDKRENIVGQSYKTISIYNFGSEYCPVTALRQGRERPKVLYLRRTGRFLQGIANYFMDEHGRKQGYLITSSDVTELSRKQVELEHAKEDAELASQHKSRFLARMSHELRTPMNAILGFNDMTRSKLQSLPRTQELQELDDYLARLKSSSLDLLNLLNDILEVSNLESGAITLSEKPLDLQNLLDEISAKAKQNCSAKQLEWTTHFDERTSSSFIADGLQLQQVLNNLISNAIEYTPPQGRIDFFVRQKDRKDGKSLLSFVVRDTGIGIPEDKLEKIFHPFEQVEPEDADSANGRGLGLTIVRRILELFDTDVVVQSELGKGSEFSFEVWLQENACTDKITATNVKGRFTGQKALVVDDVRINRIVLVNLLQEIGFITDEAENGKEGVEMFENAPENTYSIIFMDIQMPVMNGWESATVIRNLPRQDAKTVPIVTISANAFPEDVAKSIASGMNAHYAKPIQKDILSDVLVTYCRPQSEPRTQ